MKNRQWRYYLLYWLMVFFPAHYLGAQGIAYQSVEVDSLINPPLLKEGGEMFSFDSLRIHIGSIYDTDAPRTYTFPFRNVSGKNVRITKITTSCGCTAAAFSLGTLAPGMESMVTLVYNPKNRIGTVETYAFVYTDISEKHPVARLMLIGEVVCSDEWRYLPSTMGTLRMKRKQIVFSEMTSNVCPSERILCANIGKKPLKLSAQMLPPYAVFQTEPEVIPPGQEADTVITVDGSKLPDNLGNGLQFNFIVEGVAAPLTDRLVRVTIKRLQ